MVDTGVQTSATGSYFPPVFNRPSVLFHPPHTNIDVPVHTAAWEYRAVGVAIVEIGCHASLAGSYRPPVARSPAMFPPPQISIRLPSQTTEKNRRPEGAPVVDTLVQVSATGSYRPPLFAGAEG